ncbi:MAG: DUF1080 domain-containing protein [Cyclobacteriaceae bacterium]|nr:DUF1080 domain-containing protein [Cyclobacteriaceae bacterium]
MTKFIYSTVLSLLLISCASKQTEWIDLFNGKDLTDWTVKIHHHEVGENFGNTFRVADNMIQVRYDQYGDFNDQFAHLYYNKPFSNYHLKLEYQFTGELQQGAPEYTILNSGVMFHSQDPHTMLKEQNWPISVEMQFLAGLGDGQPRPTGNMCSPGTDIVFEGKVYDGHCLNSTSKTYGKDEWVKAELIVWNDSLITQIINGDTVLQYSKPTMGGGVVNGYDSAIWKPGTALKSGYIALQSEGQPINFRNVKLRQLE